MAQKRVDIATGRDHSLASYVPPSGVGDALAVVGNAAVRFPQQFGTSCLVDGRPTSRRSRRARWRCSTTPATGISEAEFVYDDEREEFLLLDVNTRPWKWIGMPVAAGANLPMAAYAAVTDAEYESSGVEPTRWVYLRDYLALLAGDDVFWDQLSTVDRRLAAARRRRRERGEPNDGDLPPVRPRAGREVVRDGVRRPRLLLLLLRAVGSASTAIRYLFK